MCRIADRFFEIASAYPEKIAVICGNESICYRALADLVSQYSNYLLSKGVAYGDHIGMPMNNSIQSVVMMMTAANLGVALVPINPTLPLQAMQTAFTYADVKHMVASRALLEQIYESGQHLIREGSYFCIDGSFEGAFSLTEAESFSRTRPIVDNVSGNERFIISMTSGSTGVPKPIALTQKTKFSRVIAHINLYGLTRDDRILAATPLYHTLAERLVLIPLMIGCTSVVLPTFTPKIWLSCVVEQQVTFTIAVSAQLNQIASLLSEDGSWNITSLRSLVSSSSLLEPDVKNTLLKVLQCEFHEMYGTSEISTATNINFKDALHKKQSVGKPLPEASIVILKDNEDLCPEGEIGEIACKTSLICDGYYGMDRIFHTSISKGYFKTGDLGYLDKDGYLYFSGRKKDLIITGGVNVYPSDIEKVVLELSEIEECAAFGYPDERLGEVVALAIVLKDGKLLDQRVVQRYCARHLADFQQPHKIYFLDKLPKNSMGKLARYLLRERVCKI